MKQRGLLFSLLVVASTALVAQEKRKIDFQLDHYLRQPHTAGEEVDLFIHGPVTAVSNAVRANGGLVKMSLGRLVAARVPVDRVRQLAEATAVESFEFSMEPGQVLCDSMRVKAHVNEVHAGLAPLPQAYDGEGVVVGIIDTGLDVDHPDFLNANGTTRVAYYWDQTLTGSGTPPEFGYGREWNSAQINANQIGSTDTQAHGTTVTGSATGNAGANGRHMGVAPKADIIVVKFGGANFRAVVADGVKYVFDRAAAMGKPAVVNASLGTYSGSHDGKDAAALFIDSLINHQRGRALVCAAGNYGQAPPIHLRTEVDSDTSFTWFNTNTNAAPYNIFNFPNVYFEVWADLDEFANVQFAMGADRVTPTYQFRGRTGFQTVGSFLGGTITEPLVSASGNTLGTVQYYAQQRGDQVQLQVLMVQPDSGTYNWRFMTTGSGRFDVWSSLLIGTSNMTSNLLIAGTVPTVAEYPAMINHVPPDKDKHIVDSWACSDHTLTVANYWNVVAYTAYSGNYINSGATPYMLSANSSAGPTRDERWKPDIAAPGDVTFSAAPLPILSDWLVNNPDPVDAGAWHIRNGGTSMASPVVCGAVALYLQKCPNASWEQIRAAFLGTTWGDDLTGDLPNKFFGYGRVHAFDALVTSNLPDIAITTTDTEMCSNAPLDVSAPAGFDAYLWSNGSTDNPTSYVGEGPLSVVASTNTGCAHSNALTFTVLPAPATPTITANGADLTSSTGPAYQWYVDGDLISGATGQLHTALITGDYTVQVTDANGCSATSAPVSVIISGVPDNAGRTFAAWPSPARETLTVRIPANATGNASIVITDASGRRVLEQRTAHTGNVDLSLQGLSNGSYTLQVMQGDARWETRFVKVP